MQDVLKAVEDGFVVLDFVALAGVRLPLPALEVGVDLTRVGGVLFVMGHLQAENPRQLVNTYTLSPHHVKLGYWSLSVLPRCNRAFAPTMRDASGQVSEGAGRLNTHAGRRKGSLGEKKAVGYSEIKGSGQTLRRSRPGAVNTQLRRLSPDNWHQARRT